MSHSKTTRQYRGWSFTTASQWKYSLLLLLSSFSLFGCSSLLYHPVDHQVFLPKKMGLEYRDVFIKTQDGETLHSWYFEAKRPKGLILFFHGNGENLSTHFNSLTWILKHGYSFLIFDYRGYWRSTGTPSPEGTVLDGKAVLNWGAKESQRLNSVPLIVFGQSLGGAVALRATVEAMDEVQPRLVIVESTFHSYQSVGASVLRRHWLTWPIQWLPYLVLSDSWAPEDHIHKLSPIPLVVMHGTKDKIVSFKLGQEVWRRAKDPKEFWQVEGGTHISSFWREEGKWQKKFLKKLQELL